MPPITFGTKEAGKTYIKRPGVYGLFFKEGKIAVIQTGDGKYFLPGGGIENDETHEECLIREALEEMGVEIEKGPFIGAANRYFYSTSDYKYYLSEGYFYKCELGKVKDEPIEENHFLRWLEPEYAIKHLFHEHQVWAVMEALKR
jgi:8-oxo-dGTP diphosphatase